MQPAIRVNLLMVPVIVLVCLAALVLGIFLLRIVLGQRLRTVGISLLGVLVLGAFVASGLLLVYRARSVAQHELLRAEMARHDAIQAQIHHRLAAERLQPHSAPIEAPVPIESAVELEVSNSGSESEAEFASEAAFQETATPNINSETDTIVVQPTDPVAQAVANEDDTAQSTNTNFDNSAQDQTPEEPSPDPGKQFGAYDEPEKTWLMENDEFVFEGFPAKVVSSIPAPDVATCVEDLSVKLAEECNAYVRSYTQWKIHVTPELVKSAIRDEHVEPVGGSQKVVHKLLVFDRDFKQQASVEIQRAKVTSRLGKTGIISGVVLTSLTGLFGALSLTHRRRERRLSS